MSELDEEEFLRFDFPSVKNELPALTFECSPGHDRHKKCRGETHWGGKCQCHCHLPVDQHGKAE